MRQRTTADYGERRSGNQENSTNCVVYFMYLMGIVEFKDEIDCYMPVGQDEYK